MKLHRHLIPSLRSSLRLLAVAILGVAASGCATHHRGCTPAADIPPALAVCGPVVGAVHATGVQIYTCTPDAAGVLAWKLKAPDATFTGDFTGTHYAGPTWQAADGSIVAAAKLAEHPAPVDAVPWLLLKATTHEGAGCLSEVSYIHRLHTTGGKAPGIDAAKPGDEVRIPYTADYIFYGPGAVVRSAAN